MADPTCIVTFDTHGQRCMTTFDADSELTPIEWICRCYDNGHLVPVKVAVGSVVIPLDEIMAAVIAY